jgi:hypothetical protein
MRVPNVAVLPSQKVSWPVLGIPKAHLSSLSLINPAIQLRAPLGLEHLQHIRRGRDFPPLHHGSSRFLCAASSDAI